MRLCYILPKYDAHDATHFAHLHDLLKAVSSEMSVWLVVEKGSVPPPSMGYAHASLMRLPAPFRIFEYIGRLAYIRVCGYRQFYVHYSFAGAFSASIIARCTGGRVFYWNCGEPWKYTRSFFRERFERLTYKMIHHLVTGAPFLADQYVRVYGLRRDRVRIMPNWIDLARFSPRGRAADIRTELSVPQDAKLIFFAHRLSERKGADLILPIFKKVIENVSNTYLAIAGTGPEEENIRDGIKKDPLLAERVRLLGAVPNDRIPDFLRAADVFLMPSREEGFPRVLLESWAMGTPIVAADVGAIRDLVLPEQHHLIISPGDVEGFARAVVSVLAAAPGNREHLRGLVRQYDVRNVAKQFVALFT